MANRVRREAIEVIKDFYENGGGVFPDRFAIRDHLLSRGIRCGAAQASRWERQARYERADQSKATTWPTADNKYERRSAPTHAERVSPMATRMKHDRTRIINTLRMAKAYAAQPDASAIEQARVGMLEVAQIAYERAGETE